MILPYASTDGISRPDRNRPFFGLDYGNQGNYVINQGAPKRTFGVVGYWHRDFGNGVPVQANPGSNPASLAWVPLAGTASAWCGLRSHGDITVVDPVTGNPFNQSVLDYNGSNRGQEGPSGSATVIKNFPGYGSQWDQMLYRDVVISSDNVTLHVSFKYRTAMSTAALTDPARRVGWFDKDPLKPPSMSDGNFVSSSDAGSSAPVDSFMVYVGVPVEPVAGSNPGNDFTASDGFKYEIFDRQRRWFSEVLRITPPATTTLSVEILSKAGLDTATTMSVALLPATVQPILDAQTGTGGTVRIVFRVKTNRGSDDEDNGASGFSSGTAGAAIVDDVNVNVGGANLISNGTFEAASSIDNSLGTPATVAWKTTGKPPAVFFHAHSIVPGGSDIPLDYSDPNGSITSSSRICNMYGRVATPGDHDNPAGGDKPGGVFGSSFQDRQDALASPTINLRSSGPMDYNAMGINTPAATATGEYALWFDALTNVYDYPNTGNSYRIGWQSYPATQPNGVKCWGDIQKTTYFSTGITGCWQGFLGSSPGALANGLIITSNPGGIPDSIRVYVEHVARCYTLPISSITCSPSSGPQAGGYFDNLSIGLIDYCAGGAKNVNVSANGLVSTVDGHPDILCTPGGVLVTAWGRRSGRVSYSRSRDHGEMFSRARQIDEPAGHPALARTPPGSMTGTLVLATVTSSGVSCSRSLDDGIGFFPAVPIPNSTPAANPAIAVDAGGQLHVVWDNASAVYHAKSLDEGLSFITTMTAISADEGPDRLHTLPDVAVDDLHNVYAIWNHSHTTATPEDWVQIAVAPNQGSFGAPTTISDTGSRAYDAQIVAGTGVVYALWIYRTGGAPSPDIVHLASAPSGSSTFTQVAELYLWGKDGGGTAHHLCAVVGAGNTLHVVVQALANGNPECFYFTRSTGSSSFTTPIDISNSPGPSYAPAVTLDDAGAPVIVWSDQFGGAQDVFFTHP